MEETNQNKRDTENTTSSDYENPDKETLRHQLEIQWKDHFQTRQQTWKPLEIQAAMLLAVIAADVKLNNLSVLVIFVLFLLISTVFGIAVTVHHRGVQVKKFHFIYMIEKKLGLHNPGYMEGIREPEQFEWTRLDEWINPRKLATPAFILIMQIMILIFSIVYLIVRISI